MKTLKILALSALALAVHTWAAAQQREILAITGATGMEELDETEAERLEDLLQHPVHINSAPRSRLLSCGLFTRFQAASICDYRSNNGDILSLSELAMLDGFSPDAVKILAPFIRTDGHLQTGPASHKTETMARATARTDGQWSAALKCRHIFEDGGSIAAAGRKKSDGSWSCSGSAALYGRRKRGRLILGDYSARFGQGLGLWSGFSMSGLTSPDAFVRRPSGLSPSWSVSPDGPLRGIAADFDAGHTTISGMLAFPGLRSRMDGSKSALVTALSAMNIARTAHCSEYSATIIAGTSGERKLSADIRWTPGDLGMFAEGALDFAGSSGAAVAGLVWTPAYGRKVSILARHYGDNFNTSLTGGARSANNPKGEQGVAAGLQLPHLTMTADRSYSPGRGGKTRLLCTFPLEYGPIAVKPRTSLRFQDGKTRAEARLECAWVREKWAIRTRADFVRGVAAAGQGYIEGALKSDAFSIFARGGLFIVDNWDDRIYVYERDAPCSFNIPAYYGRGYNGSIFASFRHKKSRFYLRLSGIRHVTGKPGRAELRLQYNLTL